MKLQPLLSTLTLTLTLVACGTPMPIPDSGTGGGGGTTDGGFFASFTAPSTTSVNNSVLLTVSGETSATEGLSFPPAAGDSIYFQDGWDVTFQHVLVTVGSVTAWALSRNGPGLLSRSDPCGAAQSAALVKVARVT